MDSLEDTEKFTTPNKKIIVIKQLEEEEKEEAIPQENQSMFT